MIADCSASLSLTPGYQRALMRRAKAYEALGKPYDALQGLSCFFFLCSLLLTNQPNKKYSPPIGLHTRPQT